MYPMYPDGLLVSEAKTKTTHQKLLEANVVFVRSQKQNLSIHGYSPSSYISDKLTKWELMMTMGFLVSVRWVIL